MFWTPAEWECLKVQAIKYPEFEIDPGTGELTTATARITLPPRLTDLFVALAEDPGVLKARKELYELLWKETHAQYRAGLDTAVKNLRKALSRAEATGVVIETVRGRGYRLMLDSQANLRQTGAVRPPGGHPLRGRSTHTMPNRDRNACRHQPRALPN